MVSAWAITNRLVLGQVKAIRFHCLKATKNTCVVNENTCVYTVALLKRGETLHHWCQLKKKSALRRRFALIP